jgi:hypothetical protein
MPQDGLDTAREFLRSTFGHADFRGLQTGVIGEILAAAPLTAQAFLPLTRTPDCFGSSSISVPLAVLQICPGALAINFTHGVALVTIGNHDPTPSLTVATGGGLQGQLQTHTDYVIGNRPARNQAACAARVVDSSASVIDRS